MNKLMNDLFSVILGICHFFFIAFLLVYAFLGDKFTYQPFEMRILLSVLMLGGYVIFFGVITTLIAIKEELIEANRKMTIFFDFVEGEATKKGGK